MTTLAATSAVPIRDLPPSQVSSVFIFSIAVDHGFVYWTSNTELFRASTTRANGHVATFARLPWAQGSAELRSDGTDLFAAGSDRIVRMPLNGGPWTSIAHLSGLTSFIADASYVYWSSLTHAIVSVPVVPGATSTLVQAHHVTSIAVDATSVYYLDDTSSAGRNLMRITPR